MHGGSFAYLRSTILAMYCVCRSHVELPDDIMIISFLIGCSRFPAYLPIFWRNIVCVEAAASRPFFSRLR